MEFDKFSDCVFSLLQGEDKDGKKVKIASVVPALTIVFILLTIPKKWNFWPFIKSHEFPQASEGTVWKFDHFPALRFFVKSDYKFLLWSILSL